MLSKKLRAIKTHHVRGDKLLFCDQTYLIKQAEWLEHLRKSSGIAAAKELTSFVNDIVKDFEAGNEKDPGFLVCLEGRARQLYRKHRSLL